MMTPRIIADTPRQLIGMRRTMRLSHNQTGELWRRMMPRRIEIPHPLNSDLISMAIYPPGYFANFDLNNELERWAAIQVTHLTKVPDGMETFLLTGGLYAVFDYKGSSADSTIFEYIYNSWLPNSGYVLDDRPHFEILGEKYKNNDARSEEEIWIPIKPKPSI